MENLDLFGLKIPASWSTFAGSLDEIADFNLIDIDAFYESIIIVPEKEPVSINFQTADYSTSLFVSNAKIGLIFYAIQISLLIPFLIILLCRPKCQK